MDASPFIATLRDQLPSTQIVTDPATIARTARDSSWLSPILSEILELGEKRSEGSDLGLLAVVRPDSLEALKTTISLAVQARIPITVRGGATTNFGQTIAREGGILLDMRSIDGVEAVGEDCITVAAGTTQGAAQAAAAAEGKELTILTTTFSTATAAGWVAGGHVGLGADSYGTIWDGNVLGVRLLTAEEEPREIELSGDALAPALHTYGTTGVITAVTFPLKPISDWAERVYVFDSYSEAIDFTEAASLLTEFPKRAVNAQPAAVAQSFVPLRKLIPKGASVVLAIFDRAGVDAMDATAGAHGAAIHPWREGPDSKAISLGQMVYGHRMLWIKKAFPEAGFFHTYLDPTRFRAQLEAIEERFGDSVFAEFKYIRSPWLIKLWGRECETLPVSAFTFLPSRGATLETVIAGCEALGIQFMNPHTLFLDDSGFFPDFQSIADFKRETDPYNLLNPGKISDHYLAQPTS